MITQEGTEVCVDLNTAQTSKLIRGIIDDNGHDDPVPLTTISETILTVILEYMSYISKNKKPKIMRPLVNSDLKSSIEHDDKLFFTHFIDEALWKGYLYDITLAANFLDVGSLLKLSVARLACLLMNRTVDSLRSIFGITDHGFAPDEYQEIM